MTDAAKTTPDFYFQGRHTPEVIDRPEPGSEQAQEDLGVLATLAGTWSGSGFNTIWRPHDLSSGQDRFLELNLTTETLDFSIIPGPIPNRGLLMPDIDMFGVTYMQQIAEASDGAGLHVEPGIWVNIPATSNPDVGPTVARMASIPHGTVILAQGDTFAVGGGPEIEANNIIPFPIGQPAPPNSDFPNAEQAFTELNLDEQSDFRVASPGVTQAMVENPNSVLTEAIDDLTITSTTVLRISTTSQPVPGGGTANTAFLGSATAPGGNANAVEVDATFWILGVLDPDGQPGPLRLLYTQLVQLDFNGLRWPHVTVAALIKQ